MMDKVIIGPITYSISKKNDLRDPDNPDIELNGSIDYDPAEITMGTDLCPQMERVVLWHEVIHAILVQAGITEHNEQVIDALSYGLVGVLQANPPLREPVQE